ncbi:MAG: hypothetical protein JO001_13115 [Alphaproteobacteria bacterium]|nr:hypothetical protein [Alphaproteobacteria bacterium]
MAALLNPEYFRETARGYRSEADREDDPDRAELFRELAVAFENEAILHEPPRVPPSALH